MLDHGGNLQDAVRRYGRPCADWLDLSTGINPHAYPVPTLAADAWHRLPEPHAGLLHAAREYYDAPALLPVAGTQAAIQALPRLRASTRVIVASPAYAEHAQGWRRAGHAVSEVPHAQLAAALDRCDVMVVCNPNNPTGATMTPETLRQWAAQLAARGGWLIVDEAFADAAPASSVAACAAQDGMIVLRSVGKFFGLAGLRLGFVLAAPALLARLQEEIGPWSVSGPAQQIGATALADRGWQQAMRLRLQADGDRLQQLLAAHGIASHGCALYQYWPEARAAHFADHMARQGIWIRRFAHGVRLGLPPDAQGWQRLQQALHAWNTTQGIP